MSPGTQSVGTIVRPISFCFAPKIREANGWCERRPPRARLRSIFATPPSVTPNFLGGTLLRKNNSTLGKRIFHVGYSVPMRSGAYRLGRSIYPEEGSTIIWKATVKSPEIRGSCKPIFIATTCAHHVPHGPFRSGNVWKLRRQRISSRRQSGPRPDLRRNRACLSPQRAGFRMEAAVVL